MIGRGEELQAKKSNKNRKNISAGKIKFQTAMKKRWYGKLKNWDGKIKELQNFHHHPFPSVKQKKTRY